MGVNGIYGLSGSGLDVESMVKMGMMTKQSQYEKMQQNYIKQQWTKETYVDIYDKLNDYDDSISTYTRSENMNARTAESSNSAVKATATANAQLGTHYITVNKTATNARLTGTQSIGPLLTSVDGITSGDIITFSLGADSDSGVSQIAEYASASFSSTALSTVSKAKNLLYSALASATTVGENKSLDEITSLKIDGDNVKITGTISNKDANDILKTSNTAVSVPSTNIALSFSVGTDGTQSNATVNITYGDLAKLLNNDDATFQDFVDLLNQKLKTESVNIEASYDDADGFTFTNTTASSDAKVYGSLGIEGIGNAFQTALYNASTADEQTKLFDANGKLNEISDTDGGKEAVYTPTSNTTVSITVGDKTTFNDLASAINGLGINVKGYYDASNKTFSFYNKNVGEDNSIAISATDTNAQNLLNAMGLKKSEGNKDLSSVEAINFSNTPNYLVSGTNSSVLIDGDKRTGTNSIDAGGVIYNITNVTEKTTAVVNVNQDVDKIVDNVKSFIEGYNTLLADLYEKYEEKPNSSYAPLTDAQKAAMTEDQIKKWEEKAKAGLLYHDQTIRRIIDSMRSAISDPITSLSSSNYDRAYSIGISTKGNQGQLQLDEDKLRTALSNDADSVYNVFAKLDTSATNAAEQSNGIARRLGGGIGSIMYNAENTIKNKAGTSSDTADDSQLSTLLRNLQTRMSNFKSMMDAFETRLYKKYDAMEAALASLGTQLNYVTSAFS